MKLIHADGHVLGRDEHLEPVLEAGRYEKLTFDWVAYDPDRVPAEVEFWKNGVKSSTVSAPRSMMTYSNRFTEEGTQTLVLKAGPTGYTCASTWVRAVSISARPPTAWRSSLTPAGRSNGDE